jgi:hypothetical protein
MTRRAPALLLVTALAACASTLLTSVWVDTERAGGAYRRILVVGLAERLGNRAVFEHDFAARLAERGAAGVPGTDAFPDLVDFDRRRAVEWARANALDGVLISRLVDVREERRYVPPEVRYDLLVDRVEPVVVAPGMVQTDRTFVIETSLFDARDGKLVYAATSETFNPSSDPRAARELADALVRDLAARQLLPGAASEEGSPP